MIAKDHNSPRLPGTQKRRKTRGERSETPAKDNSTTLRRRKEPRNYDQVKTSRPAEDAGQQAHSNTTINNRRKKEYAYGI